MDERNLNPIEQALEEGTVELIKKLGVIDAFMACVLFVGVGVGAGGSAAILYLKHVLKNN